MVRQPIAELIAMGSFPSSKDVNLAEIKRQEELLNLIIRPVSDAEAKELIKLFGPDDYFGLAWTVVHLIESAPHWPLEDCLFTNNNEWMTRLKARSLQGNVKGDSSPH